MALEVGAEVQERLGEQVALDEHERDEELPYAALAVEEGVDGLDLVVDQGGVHQRREPGILVDVPLQRVQSRGDLPWRWGDVGSLSYFRTRRADPVLYAAKLARVCEARLALPP
jgi:hypothetical protein